MRRVTRLSILYALAVAAVCSPRLTLSQKGASQQSAPDLMIQYGCPTCHVVPNVPGAVGKVGPSLQSLSQRSYLAGSLPNTPHNLIQWIMHPQHFQPGTAMPETGVTEQDAHRIGAFLNSSR